MYALCIEMITGGERPALGSIEAFDEVTRWGSPSMPDHETWGESESAQSAAAAMAALAGVSTPGTAREAHSVAHSVSDAPSTDS